VFPTPHGANDAELPHGAAVLTTSVLLGYSPPGLFYRQFEGLSDSSCWGAFFLPMVSEVMVVASMIPTITPSETSVSGSGITVHGRPPLMKPRVFECRACSTSLAPMNARMAARP